MNSAKAMAGDLCRYEDALSGELSDTRIWTVGINGCIPDVSIQAGVEEIKRIQKASARQGRIPGKERPRSGREGENPLRHG